jgi:hypothetical protein
MDIHNGVGLADPFQSEFLDQLRDMAETSTHIGRQRFELGIDDIVQSFNDPRQAPAWVALGNAFDGQGWDLACSLRNVRWQASCRRPGIRQEKTEGTQPGDRAGPEALKGISQ